MAIGLRRCHLLFPIQISAKRTIMPIYAYRCDACGHGRDVLQKMSDAPLTDCPSCGAAGSFKKQLTAAGFQLKGSGWYVTDFRGGNNGTNGTSAPAATGGAAASAPASGGESSGSSSASASSTSTSTSSAPAAPAGGGASA